MNWFTVITVIGAVAVPALAQRETSAEQRELRARRDKKLAEPFLKNAEWVTDLARAKARAKLQGRVIFAYFTRSYAP
ncbi:MAG: hypothetical protein KDC87_00930 [Planctomycetes bacterium]|nr:hypothetical protein [Planctomycetota bacterium]MCB9868830.1 hypothetical protein [Planctomycetota bacterium]